MCLVLITILTKSNRNVETNDIVVQIYVSRDCPFYLCAPVALLRPSGLSYAPSVMCLHTGPVPLLVYVSDSCWGCDVKCITESPAGAVRTVMM